MAEDPIKETTATAPAAPIDTPAESGSGLKANPLPTGGPLTPAEIAAKRADLQKQLDDLTPKPKTIEEMSDDELHVAYNDALVRLLGSHPHLEAIWNEIKKRLLPPEESPAKAA